LRYALPLRHSVYRERESDDGGELQGAHFPQDIILTSVRWYVVYPLSDRHVEELMEERGVAVDHATLQRWVVKYSPQLEAALHRHKRPVWVSWRMDETYMKVKGQWRYLYHAVDKHGHTIDFLLTEQRDETAALRFLAESPHRQGQLPLHGFLSKLCDRAGDSAALPRETCYKVYQDGSRGL
jgi:transposase-like protein